MDKYRSAYKKKRRGFHGYKPEKVTTTTTQSELLHVQDGEEPDVSLNSNSSQDPSISGVVSRKMKRDSVSKSTMTNLQAQGYKIIDSNILQSMLNEVGRCTSCGEQKLQIRENVNKQIGMCDSFNTSPQV